MNLPLSSAISSLVDLLPTSPLASLTTRKYTLPDKAVASQVLMYRQLLHTSCRPGLRLSRGYEGTEAQRAVKHMPWWEQGVEQTKRMIISYDNLIVRLWVHGAILPYVKGGYAAAHSKLSLPKDIHEDYFLRSHNLSNSITAQEQIEDSDDGHIDTLINEKGLPPIPHPYWVDRLGFQQTDPVTDFRSGGVLSLAMLVHIVESCPDVHSRFLPSGDAHMLPFGITCINVTDMIAKFCMFSKSVDKMDVLLSQKPFWRMFSDPNSLLVLQELSMDMLCDVVVELRRQRQISKDEKNIENKSKLEHNGEVTVFDFAEIMARTEQRVQDDLLGSGPKTVEELRKIHYRLRVRYSKNIEKKEIQAFKRSSRSQKNAESEQPSLRADSIEDAYFNSSSETRDDRKNDWSNASDMEENAFAMPVSLRTTSNEYQTTDRLTPPSNYVDFLSDDFSNVSIHDANSIGIESTDSRKADNRTAFTIDDDDDLLS